MGNDDSMPLVLNVNDSPAGRYLITRLLRSIDCRVIEATTGQHALALARAEQPVLVVLDIKLPDISGYEVCRALKEDPLTAGCAVLQTSATFVSSEGKARGLDSGADAYLAQPFEAVELVAMVRALLRLKRQEGEAREQASLLTEADRRKDEFLAMLAHELRNPLSAILVATNLLERDDPDPAMLRRLGGTISRQARHLGRLIDDLLDVSRITRGKIQLARGPVDLCATVRTVVDGERLLIEKRHHRLTVTLPDEPVFVDADATRIEQIIMNLLGNALKYTEAGGRIALSVERGRGTAVMRLRDTGIGIAEKDLPSVWDLFYQVDSSLARTQSGLGVGLTMVRRLVEMHGGHVSVRSEGLGHGSEFVIELPAIDTPDAAVPEASGSDSTSRERLSILLVDDNADSCDLYSLAFQDEGHDVDVAYDGQQGVTLALTGKYDVAIVDVGLPILDGYEVARRVREGLGERRPYLIALTGYGRADDRARALEAGFDVHRVKPIDAGEIARVFATVRPRAKMLA